MARFQIDDAIVEIGKGTWTCHINGEVFTNVDHDYITPLSTVFLEVTTDCNLSCAYCYQKNNRSRDLQYQHAANAIEWALRSLPRPIQVVFFGGEPLTRSSFIREVVEQYHKKVKFGVQTNGLLLSAELIDIFAENDIGISISFDGLPSLHDEYRVFPGGCPSSERVVETMSLMAEKKVPFGVITVIGKKSAGRIHDILQFLHQHGVASVSLIPMFNYADAPSPQEHAKMLLDAASYIMTREDLTVRELSAWASTLMLKAPKECACGLPCPAGKFHIAVTPWGTVYGCPRLKSISLGEEGVPSAPLNASARSKKCRTCHFLGFCNETCPAYTHYIVCNFMTHFAPQFIAMLCKNKRFLCQLLEVKT